MEAPIPDIIARARKGDTEAFGELVRAYRKPVYALVSGITGENDEAEDIAQSCFLRAFRHIGELRDERRFGSWLYAIARNVCRDWLRENAQTPDLVGDPSRLAAGVASELPSSPETAAMASAERRAIRAAVRGLPARYRTVMLLRCISGLSHVEIAEATGASVAAVTKTWHRARQMLRERYRALVEGPADGSG